MRKVTTRDLIAIGFSAGYKLGGGSTLGAFGYGLSLRFAMHLLNWPPDGECPPLNLADKTIEPAAVVSAAGKVVEDVTSFAETTEDSDVEGFN